jgi:hypothetical protein
VPKAAEIGALNTGLRGIAQRCSLRLIDFNAVLSEGDEFKAGLSDDGKHPNARASRLMAESAEPVLIEVFANTR